MLLTVKCYATLSVYQPPGGKMEVEEGARVSDILQQLGLPLDQVKVVFVNGRHSAVEQPLAEGDRIAVFPAVGGG